MSDPTLPDMPDSDATIMIPRPGGKRAPSAPPSQPVSNAPPPPPMRDDSFTGIRVSGVNPLVAAANPLLNLIPQIRGTLSHPDPNGLRDFLLRTISEFEQNARNAGATPEKILVARYALCTAIDEAVSSTPWGGTAQWANASLLVTLHKETGGGEKFFQLLSKMAEDPLRNLDLIELMYACLALGFEGRYRLMDSGKTQLEQLRHQIYGLIRQQRSEFERDLSPRWHGVVRKPKHIMRKIPPWVVLSGMAFILFAVFLTLTILLNQTSDPVFSELAGIKANAANIQRAAAPISKPRLRQFLTTEIAQGALEVQEDSQNSRVVISGDNLFEPGSTDLNPAFSPIMQRIAEALNKVPGSIVITGHTDNKPIRSLRFPSNYHLSLERAQSVTQLISQSLTDPTRMQAEGMADAQPLAPNDTDANRARNRRVEILLRAID